MIAHYLDVQLRQDIDRRAQKDKSKEQDLVEERRMAKRVEEMVILLVYNIWTVVIVLGILWDNSPYYLELRYSCIEKTMILKPTAFYLCPCRINWKDWHRNNARNMKPGKQKSRTIELKSDLFGGLRFAIVWGGWPGGQSPGQSAQVPSEFFSSNSWKMECSIIQPFLALNQPQCNCSDVLTWVSRTISIRMQFISIFRTRSGHQPVSRLERRGNPVVCRRQQYAVQILAFPFYC